MNDNQNNVQQGFTPEVQPPQQPNGGNKKGLAITSMILGILSIVISCYIYVSVPAAIISIILGAVSLKDKASKGFALAGIITAIVGLVVAILWVTVIGALILAAGGTY